MQGKKAESAQMEEEIHQSNPEHLHSRLAIARRCVLANDLERAESLLQPVFKLDRLHFSEYALFSAAQIELLVAQGKMDAARDWMELLKATLSDHPAVAELNELFERARPKAKKK